MNEKEFEELDKKETDKPMVWDEEAQIWCYLITPLRKPLNIIYIKKIPMEEEQFALDKLLQYYFKLLGGNNEEDEEE